MANETTIEDARLLDASDPIAHLAQKFHFPRNKDNSRSIYLCGNSLGLQPRTAAQYVNQELEDWAAMGIDGYDNAHHPWVSYNRPLIQGLMPLTGAKEDELVVMNSLTVNLHLMLVTFFRPNINRFKIILGNNPFSSDRYAVESHLRFHGLDPREALIVLEPDPDSNLIDNQIISNTIKKHADSLSLILIEGINYYSGQAIDLPFVVQEGQAVGAVVGLDLAHAIGNIPLELHQWGVDFAVWCSYKYLNAGPAAVGGCFVHRKHTNNSDLPRFAGWWGHKQETRFEMGPNFDPTPGAQGWQLSNCPILATAPLRASLELFSEVGMKPLRDKSIKLTGFLEKLLYERMADRTEIITPKHPLERGCQLSLRVPGGKETFTRLTQNNIICDWREPDVIRVAPAPIYNSYQDVYRFVEVLSAQSD